MSKEKSWISVHTGIKCEANQTSENFCIQDPQGLCGSPDSIRERKEIIKRNGLRNLSESTPVNGCPIALEYLLINVARREIKGVEFQVSEDQEGIRAIFEPIKLSFRNEKITYGFEVIQGQTNELTIPPSEEALENEE